MKKLIAGVLCVCMLSALVIGCEKTEESTTATAATTADAGDDTTESEEGGSTETGIINLWSFTDEVPNMVDKYIELNPEFGERYEIVSTVISTTDNAYEPALDAALAGGGADAPDLYCAEAAFVIKYCSGDASSYAATYESLGIDIDAAIEEAGIAQYSIEVGSNADGEVVGLGYQATGGAFIYRRSIATDTFGTDEPDSIASEVGPGWDKFFEAAATLKDAGYAIVSGDGDIWHAIENSSEDGWIVDGALVIDPLREEFLDYSLMLKENGYSNDTQDWTEAWYGDMAGTADTQVFGFFGPAWLINYVIADHCGGTAAGEGTYGDWAVCNSPIGFFWGGTWLIPAAGTDVPEGVAEILTWITLDCSETGLQYMWANGVDAAAKDSVASATVMAMSDGTLDFLAGQNMFDVFVPANEFANGSNLTQYDGTINGYWRDQVRQYSAGEKTRDEAIAGFKQMVADNLDVVVE
ncbi:MAG TPA: extracellular solute-binding protein [Saccharofermentans sp.]|nr:extracellular solute-binding protein [Saccharofermentans sp.]